MPKSTKSVVTPQAKFKDETSRDFLRHIATGNALVFAAYPGDEVLGCTGALLNHAKAGQVVRVIVLTDGAAESVKDRSAIREQARYAGQLIGVGGYESWGLAVAALEYGETLVRRLMDSIPEAGIENLYAPSVFETDPGRSALGLAAIEAMRRLSGVSRTVQYEVAVPMVATALLDLSDDISAKQEALSCLTWLEHRKGNGSSVNVLALNQFRAASLGPDVKAAEGYAILEREVVLKEPLGRSVVESLMHLPAGIEGGPLVSVIIRSMDRPSLVEALDSVAAQTWPHIEVIVVCAKGKTHSPLPSACGRYPLRMISSEQHLNRSQAANVGLDQAQGDYLIFLDDDDLFLPDHIAHLAETLHASRAIRAAYAGVRVDVYRQDGKNPEESFNFNDAFSREKLWGRNFIPMHAVLFSRSLVSKDHCRFDETLHVFEDWDFWIQLSRLTDFQHVDRISAIYRNRGASGLGVGDSGQNADLVKAATGTVFDKWKGLWSGVEWAELIHYRDVMCEQADKHVKGVDAALGELRKLSSERGDAIQYLEGTLKEQTGTLKFLEKQSSDRAQVITDLEGQLRFLEQQSGDRAEIITDLEEQLRFLEQQSGDRAEIITDLEEQLRFLEQQSGDRAEVITDLEGQLRFLEQQSENRASVIDHLQEELTHNKQHLTELKNLSDSRHNRITELESTLHALQRDLQTAQFREQGLYATIDELANSTSWRVTKPLRMASRLAKGNFRDAWRSIKRNVGVEVEQPRIASSKSLAVSSSPLPCREDVGDIPESAWQGELVDIRSINPLQSESPGRIAIHAHVFYSDLAEEMAGHLEQIPWEFDLYVSAASREAAGICRKHFSRLSRLGKMIIKEVPNRGRDIAPMFTFFRDSLLEYDYVAHIHTKKSLYNAGATQGWREYLLGGLLGSQESVRRIFNLFLSNQHIGLIYPQNFSGLPYIANTWLSNLGQGRYWCQKLGVEHVPNGYFSYPAGSMFWAKIQALRPIFELCLTLEDFPDEAGQTDGTLAHCLERLLPITIKHTGYSTAILRDENSWSWSPWRMDQYLSWTHEQFKSMLSGPETRLVIFDIFDTLLLRPLLNPESIKRLIAGKLDENSGQIYLKYRARAESEARQQAQRDVGMAEIFRRFAELSGLTESVVEKIRAEEESMELMAVSRRPETAELLAFAVAQGKRVVLASDMYLPRAALEQMLEKHDIRGWRRLYLSSEVGLRKDSGGLYRYILEEESVIPEQVLMVGDNEQSDVQVPWDLGIKTRHVMRPVELARALPRLGPFVDDVLQQGTLNDEVTLGLIVRANFHPVTYKDFDHNAFTQSTPWSIGYSVLGPLMLSFSQWLHDRCMTDGIKHLYFLAREGQFLKQVFDRYAASLPAGITSHYLVVSRRCVSVPSIRNFKDILHIASRRYFPGNAKVFLYERFGIKVTDKELGRIWPQGKKQAFRVEVNDDGNTDDVKPLLMALEKKIHKQAANELKGLERYLETMGIKNMEAAGVVDIGYSGTIQDYLNQLCKGSLHGYYMATSHRSVEVAERHDVLVEGCFAHRSGTVTSGPPILSRSFDLERMLSSDEAQVIAYDLDTNGVPQPRFNQLSDLEIRSRQSRGMLQGGALAFVEDAIAIKSDIFANFVVNPALAQELYARFIHFHSVAENASLRALALDDHYCGRGIIN